MGRWVVEEVVLEGLEAIGHWVWRSFSLRRSLVHVRCRSLQWECVRFSIVVIDVIIREGQLLLGIIPGVVLVEAGNR